jgi:peroxiredoxin
MPALGFALLLSAVGPAAPPTALTGPHLARGDELHYVGEVVETDERVDGRLTKRSALDLRVFVLEAGRGYFDCAVLTQIRPLDDPRVAEAKLIASGTGASPKKAAPSVRVDLVRVDDRGHVVLLAPPAGPPPLLLNEKTATAPVPSLPLVGPPSVELGLFVPLPVEAVTADGTWDAAEPNRPPQSWGSKDGAVWNGRRCAELTAVQQSDGYDQPDVARAGWRREDTILFAPADGFATRVSRTITRREGRDTAGTVTVKYELRPTTRSVGTKYVEVRAEAEAAWAFAAAHADAVRATSRPGEVRARLNEVEAYLADRPGGGVFRPAIEGVKRRYETMGSGAAPPVVARKVIVTPVDPPARAVDAPAPDFVAPDVTRVSGRVKLSAVGKPAVVVFFKPGSETSIDTLAVADALHRKYGERLAVIPLAVAASAADAAKQRAELRLTVPVYDGTDVRSAYAVESVPQFVVIDATRKVRWAFDAGVGPEVGYLVDREVEKAMK